LYNIDGGDEMAGISIGAFVAIALVIAAAFYVILQKKKK
jgi:hypothetical protein